MPNSRCVCSAIAVIAALCCPAVTRGAEWKVVFQEDFSKGGWDLFFHWCRIFQRWLRNNLLHGGSFIHRIGLRDRCFSFFLV